MGKVLYRKYRSKSLDEIIGQDHVVGVLKRAIQNGTVGHAYLLTGIRGTGKTSIARILAHEINQLPYTEDNEHLDIIEIDAASNNSVEDVRNLREKVRLAPVSAAKKVYIIDEVHMLSKPAFNALLKTLEEPPEHIVFILATTDVDKLPATILSRVQRLNLRPVSENAIAKHLADIAKGEKIAIKPEALAVVARYGNGSFRDSISLLDQIRHASDTEITRQDVESTLGLVPHESIAELFDLYGQAEACVDRLLKIEQRQGALAPLIPQLLLEGKHRAMKNPSLLPLLDRLADAASSRWPDIKLYAAFSEGATQPMPTTSKQPVTSVPKPEKPAAPAKSKKQTPAEPQPLAATLSESKEFPWAAFTEAVKPLSMGAYSVLSRSGYEFDGQILRIFTGKVFAKKQLEKSLAALSSALQACKHPDATIEVSTAVKPPKDGNLRSVIDIMGGGEEVTVDD